MSDVSFFLRQGWKSIWRMRTVWLFSALPILSDLYYLFRDQLEANLSGIVNSLAALLISMILLTVGIIAVPYLVFSSSTGKPVTIGEAFSAVGEFGVRVILSGCLGLLILSPCIVLALGFSLDTSTQPPQLLNRAFILLLPFSVLGAMFYFTMFEFFAKDSRIGHSIQEAWKLFTSRFWVLAALGIVMTLVYRVFAAASGLLTVLLQSGFDGAALSTLNYLNPAASLQGNLLFRSMDAAGQMIFTVWNASIFALAYLKYSGVVTAHRALRLRSE